MSKEDRELRKAIYGCSFAVETHPKDFVLRINEKGVDELLALINQEVLKALDSIEPTLKDTPPTLEWSKWGDGMKQNLIGYNSCVVEQQEKIKKVRSQYQVKESKDAS